MPQLDHTGPEGKGPKTGRLLGACKKNREEAMRIEQYEPGKGLARSYREGCPDGKGNRLRSSALFRR